MPETKAKHPSQPDLESTAWHSLDADQVMKRLATRRPGLTTEEVRERLAQYGPNRLRPAKKTGPVKRFLLQFHNVLIYILLLAAVATALLEHWVDTGVILGVVLINAIIGFIQEGKAEQALDAIRNMLSPQAVVMRDGQRATIHAEELVPGDMVFLQAGDRVPGDLRLIEVKNLRIEEAVLTGESVPVEKSLAAVDPQADLGDRRSLAFSGTMVTYGRGVGVVVATGEQTQIGRISTMLAGVETLTTPLLRQMATFGRWLSIVIIALAAVTFIVGYLVRDDTVVAILMAAVNEAMAAVSDELAVELFMAAVSLAVAAIPEGLPAIMTITLAIGVQRMAKRHAIIRRLPAVETLGAVTIICSDKTGTLTRNEMTVKTVATADHLFEVSGVGYEPHGGYTVDGQDIDPQQDQPVLAELLRAALLCNEASVYEKDGEWHMEGDPTEGTLVAAALKSGLEARLVAEQYPRNDIIPFESEHKFMATLHHDHEGHGFIVLKGAPERVLEMCDQQRTTTGTAPLDHHSWHKRMDVIAGRGQRLLAVAVKETPADHRELNFADLEGGMTLLGLFGIIDPAREEAIEAVVRCQSAGIRVKMITGDHAVTAQAIGRELGIGKGKKALAGHELQTMNDTELQRAVREVDVFARTSPEHKLRLVTALQANNEVVAMTGDGVNDAPALKRADVGIAMGIKGTEAAKDAAEMVLADDNFASIAHAVEEGRTVYDNLAKAILFILPTNGGQAFTIVAAILLGLVLPLTPVQVLWVNMVTAVTLALALAFEPTEPGVMRRPPREPGTPLLSGFLLWRVIFVSILLVIGTFGHFLWMREHGADIELARTVAINTLVMGQVFYLFNSRYILEPVLNRAGLFGSRAVLIAVAILLVLQLLFTYAPPLQLLFGTTAIGLVEWGRILVFAVALFLLVEVEKLLLRGQRALRILRREGLSP